MLEEMAQIRTNSLRGRYDEAIAAMKDTSTMVTPPAARPTPSPTPANRFLSFQRNRVPHPRREATGWGIAR